MVFAVLGLLNPWSGVGVASAVIAGALMALDRVLAARRPRPESEDGPIVDCACEDCGDACEGAEDLDVVAELAALDCDGDARLRSIQARRRDAVALDARERAAWKQLITDATDREATS